MIDAVQLDEAIKNLLEVTDWCAYMAHEVEDIENTSRFDYEVLRLFPEDLTNVADALESVRTAIYGAMSVAVRTDNSALTAAEIVNRIKRLGRRARELADAARESLNAGDYPYEDDLARLEYAARRMSGHAIRLIELHTDCRRANNI